MARASHYDLAVRHARLLSDGEIKALHREVSRLARAAYGRDPEYQARYELGVKLATPYVAAYNERVKAILASIGGLGQSETT